MAMANVKSDSGYVDNWQSGKSLVECNLHMLTSVDSCDVSFRVGKDKKIVRAHRYVLISRSCVFHAMLCGPLAEKDEITITDVEADIFNELLRYLYTNESKPTPVNVTGLLYLAKKYAVGGLEHLCLTYLKSSLSAENACVILEQAHVFDEKQLYDRAMEVILDNGETCIGNADFKLVCRGCFDKVIGSDELKVKAEQVFSAALSWAEESCKRQRWEATPSHLRSILGETLYSIPFPDMDQKRYVEEVLPRQILTDSENVTIMAHHVCPERNSSPFRKRQQGVKSDVKCTSEMPVLTSTDVIFFDRQRKLLDFVSAASGRVSFYCSHDVDLVGVYVYGPVTAANNDYRLKIYRPSSNPFINIILIHKECPSIVQSKEGHIRAIRLKQTLHIKKGVKHTVDVSHLGEVLLQYQGDTVLTSINVGQRTFSSVVSNGPLNLICGLELKD